MPRTRIRGAAVLLALTLASGGLIGGPAHADVVVENGTINSFDSATIDYTLMLPSGASATSQVPIVFNTHGWGGAKISDPNNGRAKLLLDAGYAVLSWSARGFGASGGEANVDSQDYEVKDTRALIDMVAERPEIQLDGPGDPRMGMTGGSYAGGIQLMTAAADPRVDAIVPEITWNDLLRSLKPNGVLKTGWGSLLYGSGLVGATTGGLQQRETANYALPIHRAFAESHTLNDFTTATADWFDARSTKRYLNGATLPGGEQLPGVNVPTLLIQGLNDTLFDVTEAINSAKQISANGAPVKQLWFCGGHSITPIGASCSGTGAGTKINNAIVAWLDRHVKGDTSVDTGPAIEYQLQDGSFHSVAQLPGTIASVQGDTRLTNYIAPTSGQLTAGTPGMACYRGAPGEHAAAVTIHPDCPFPTAEWITVGTPTGLPDIACAPKPVCLQPSVDPLKAGTVLLGVPKLQVTAYSLSPEAHLFFKLIDFDRETKKAVVIDDQVTALRLTGLSSITPRIYEIDMAAVAWKVLEDHDIYLEVTASSNDHASSRVPGSVQVTADLSLPGFIGVGAPDATSVTFPDTVWGGTSAAKSVTYTNNGNAPMTLGSAFVYDGKDLTKASVDFSVPAAGDGCSGQTVAIGGSCTLEVVFNPPKSGAKMSILGFTGGDAAAPVLLFGGGLTSLNPQPAPLVFASQVVATTSGAQAITLTNLKSVPITVTKVTLSGTHKADFAIVSDGCLTVALAPGTSCTVQLTFKPGATGTRNGRITWETDGPKQPDATNANETAVLTGTGVAA